MITINPSTRQFNIPGADLVFGVTDDSGSVIKEFQCPRYVGNNLDLMGCFLRINYRNANGEIDSYLVKDTTVDGDNIVFGWELSAKVTRYRGNISFVLCATGPDTKVKWHTTMGRGQVLEGLEPDTALVEEGTSDVVAALITMVEAQTEAVAAEGTAQVKVVQNASKTAQNAAVAEIEAKGVNTLDSIPEDYTAMQNAVDDLARGRAGAIVCSVEGSAVAVNDASDNYIQGLKIFGRSTQDGVPTPEAPVEIKSIENSVLRVCGKNILPYPYDETSASQNGMSLVPQDDGGIAVSGTPTGYVDIYLYDGPPLAKRGNVTISIHGVFENVTASLGFHDAAGATIGSVNAIPEGRNYITVNLDDYPTATRWVVLIKRVNNNQPVSGVIYPQIELGEAHTEYKPYTGQAIETTHPLRGIPVTSGGNYTDENGQQWVCDEVDLERGVYVQRTKTVTLTGAVNIGKSLPNDSASWMYYYVTPNKEMNDTVPVLCDSLQYKTSLSPYNSVGFRNSNDGNSVIYLNMSSYMTENNINALGAVLNKHPIAFVYSLMKSIETPLSETEIAAYRALHSNYPNTTVLNDAGAHMSVKYAADTKLYIDNKLAALVGNI